MGGIRAGDLVVSRDQDDPDAPLVLSRVDRTYRRIAGHLQHATIRSAAGQEQTLQTTDEHPFYVVGKGWTKSKDLEAGDLLQESDGSSSTVLSSIREEHPEGVVVFNLRVENTHSYFVRAEGSTSEPVWVHNADPRYGAVGEYQRLPVNRGRWTGEAGRSGWISELPHVRGIVGDEPIPYVLRPETGRYHPDLTRWQVDYVELPGFATRTADFNLADELLAAKWSQSGQSWTASQVTELRRVRQWSWHHVENGTTVQLVPRALNDIPHLGGVGVL